MNQYLPDLQPSKSRFLRLRLATKCRHPSVILGIVVAYQVDAEKGRFEDEGWRLRKDGSRFWANVIITALKDETGKLKGFSKITRDRTEEKRKKRS